MAKPKVVIIVRGGLVECIEATQEIDIILIDHDNLQEMDLEQLGYVYEDLNHHRGPDRIITDDQVGINIDEAIEEHKKYIR